VERVKVRVINTWRYLAERGKERKERAIRLVHKARLGKVFRAWQRWRLNWKNGVLKFINFFERTTMIHLSRTFHALNTHHLVNPNFLQATLTL